MLKNIETPPYLPFVQQPDLVNIGVARLAKPRWIEPDADFSRYHNNKLQQASIDQQRVYAAEPESIDAQAEFSQRLFTHLTVDHQQHFNHDAQSLYLPEQQLSWPIHAPGDASDSDTGDNAPLEQLWRSSLWIQDDICLLQAYGGAGNSDYRLTAASVCAPSHWCLQEKIGQDFFAIHQPVPSFKKKLERPIRKLLAKLGTQPLVRANWGISDTDTLMRLPEHQQIECNADTELYLRIERQSLSKLPATGAIVFTIRVYTHPLQSIAAIDGAVTALQKSIYAMNTQEYYYKSMHRLEKPLARFFTRQRANADNGSQ